MHSGYLYCAYTSAAFRLSANKLRFSRRPDGWQAIEVGEKAFSVLIRLRGAFYQVQCGILRPQVEIFVYANGEP
ncbi:protein of unknown function [Serratia sp. Tan611]|nr:protein of unknown function [Serratia sp. Tan611]